MRGARFSSAQQRISPCGGKELSQGAQRVRQQCGGKHDARKQNRWQEYQNRKHRRPRRISGSQPQHAGKGERGGEECSQCSKMSPEIGGKRRVKDCGRGGIKNRAHDEQMDKGGEIAQNQPQPGRHAVDPVHLAYIAPINFHQRGRQADERSHRRSKDGHRLYERLPGVRQDGCKHTAHDREKRQWHDVAGDEQRPAAQIQHPLQKHAV